MAGSDIRPSEIPVRVVGGGTFAEIVALRKKEDNSYVTWKAIDLGDCSEDDKERALREVQQLSKLKHVNIVSYLNPFIDDTNLCYEMEYTDAGTLYQKIMNRNSGFSEPTVLWYIYQVLSAVEYAHAHKILHRNINSLNISLCKNHILKLGCFGISKVLSNISKNKVESMGGIPYYLSPEVAEKKERYNAKSDIWACGCVLYEMLTLKHVFDAEDLVSLTIAITFGNYDDIPEDYSDDICDLLERMLSKETGQRPTAAELVANSIFDDTRKKFAKIARDLKLICEEDEIDGENNGAKADAPVLFSSQIGEVFCWGGTKPLPQKIEDFSVSNPALEVATGRKHFAVINESGDLFTWADILQDNEEDEMKNDNDNEADKRTINTRPVRPW